MYLEKAWVIGLLMLAVALTGGGCTMGDEVTNNDKSDDDDDNSSDDDDDSSGDDDDDSSGDDDDDSSGDDDDDSSGDDDDDSSDDTDSETEENQCPKELDGNYDGWEEGNDDWAPGEVTSIVDKNHTGWKEGRCVHCHGEGKPFQPSTFHDTRMDCWSWSCARGFPGGSCHGHGPNTDWQFNHNDAEDFFGCTKAACHDKYAPGDTFHNNHGFMEAPDEFCNACHQLKWNGWPTGIVHSAQ